MIRILFTGDSLTIPSGLSYVATSLLARYAIDKEYEIGYVTISNNDTTAESVNAHGHQYENILRGIPYFNAQLNDPNKYGNFDKAVEQFKPNIVISIHDPWHLDHIALSQYRNSFYWIIYTLIETPEYPPFVMHPSPYTQNRRKSIVDIFRNADAILPVTQMGKYAISLFGVSTLPPVPLGIDISQRCTDDVSKSQVFGPTILDNDFLFMTVGVNIERKKLDRLIEAFAVFLDKMKHGRDKYKLYIHTDINAVTSGTDIMAMIIHKQLDNHIILPNPEELYRGISRSQLYARYLASDCYIGLPGGEGFGLGFAEAMLHGKPVIYTDTGGHTSFCSRGGLPVAVSDYVYTKGSYIRIALADINDAAKQMAKIVSNEKLRNRLGQAGEEIVRKQLSWDIVFPQFQTAVLKSYTDNKPAYDGILTKRII